MADWLQIKRERERGERISFQSLDFYIINIFSGYNNSMGTKACKPVRTYDEVKHLLNDDELSQLRKLFTNITTTTETSTTTG